MQFQQAAGSINANTPQTITFHYDNGNRSSQMVCVTGSLDPTPTITQIIKPVSYTRSDGTTIGTLAYAYDAAGTLDRSSTNNH